MANIALVIDSTTEDAANIALDLHDYTNFRTVALDLPTPPRDVNWASSADTEGELPANLRYQNRTITITCQVLGTTQSALLTQLGYLQQKIGRVNAEGATLKYTSASSVVCVFDLLEGSADITHDLEMVATNRAQATITFTAKPFWRAGLAAETTSTDHAETTLPVVIGTDTAPAGDVPAIGRLVIDEDQGQDQWTLIWGVQSRYYDSSADAALFYEAEGRTVQGGAATAVGPTGASGGGSNTVLQGTLTSTYQSMLSTQATAAGNHLKHVGTYRVFGRFQRPTTNTGAVSVRLAWGEGDFRRFTTNLDDGKDWAVNENEGVWTLVDLGLVRLNKVVAGTQRWEGRILAKSTLTGDDIYCDYIFLAPVDEGYGQIKVTPQIDTPTSFSARDEFDQTAGALTGKTLPVGGTWTFSGGDTDDYTVDATNHRAQRATTSDTVGARRVYASTPTLTTLVVQADVDSGTSSVGIAGIVFRLVDASNYCYATLNTGGLPALTFQLVKVKAGVESNLGPPVNTFGNLTSLRTLRVVAFANGFSALYAYTPGGLPGAPLISGFDTDLATGGTLASGKIGLYDYNATATAATRTFDNFAAWVPVLDAAVFASQSCEIRHDRVVREDSGGTLWVTPSSYRGAYAKPPPTRREGRSIRTICKLSRGNIDSMADSSIDDASFRWFWQSRGLVAPES